MKKGSGTCSFPVLEGIRKKPTFYTLEKMSANSIHLKLARKVHLAF